MVEWLKIIGLGVVGAVAYGIAHDNVTARVCVEYFTIGHVPIFGTENPTLLALGWGVLAPVQPYVETLLQTANIPRYDRIPAPPSRSETGHCELKEKQ